MTEVPVLLYTTIGAVVGAGLTQYVTHVRDRRAARALVVERLTEVEEAYVALRWPLSGDESPYSHSRIARLLGSLEAAGLIAGVSRAILLCYIAICRFYEDTYRLSHGTNLLAGQVGRKIGQNADNLRGHSNLPDVVKGMQKIAADVEKIQARVKDVDAPASELHDEALEELSRALWHPLALQFRRWKLHDLQQRAAALEKSSRDLAGLLRQMGIMYEQAASDSFLQSPENSSPDRPIIPSNVALRRS